MSDVGNISFVNESKTGLVEIGMTIIIVQFWIATDALIPNILQFKFCLHCTFGMESHK